MSPIAWPLEALWQAVEPTLPGFTAELLPVIDSTNSELMRRFRGNGCAAPQTEPTLLVAEQQTAGRGRMGRHWSSARGASLLFSLALPLQPVSWSGLSLAVGVSLADSLEPAQASTPARLRLKWPNDLWLTAATGPLKLGGILLETAPWLTPEPAGSTLRYVVIGVGLNIAPVALPDASNTPSDASCPPVQPGHLQTLLPTLDAPSALLRVVPPLVRAIKAFEQFGFAPFQSRFDRRDALADGAVQLSDGRTGTAHGVSDAGALRVFTAGGMHELTSADVRVRPAGLAPRVAGQR